jgi:hypothetical protein
VWLSPHAYRKQSQHRITHITSLGIPAVAFRSRQVLSIRTAVKDGIHRAEMDRKSEVASERGGADPPVVLPPSNLSWYRLSTSLAARVEHAFNVTSQRCNSVGLVWSLGGEVEIFRCSEGRPTGPRFDVLAALTSTIFTGMKRRVQKLYSTLSTTSLVHPVPRRSASQPFPGQYQQQWGP